MAVERSLVYEFVCEAKEHLANVTDDLLALEKAPDDTVRYRIDRLFRAMHSVKGGAGFFAFHNITELAHLMETLLKRLREQNARPDEVHLDALLAGTDLILTLLDDVEHSNQVDIGIVRDRLQRLVSGALAQLTHGAVLPHASEPVRRVYSLRVDLVEFCRDRQQPPLALVKSLLAFGTIVEARLDIPGADLRKELPTGPIYYLATYNSHLEPEQLCSATGLSAAQLTLLHGETSTALEEIEPEHYLVGQRAEPAAAIAEGGEPARKDERVNTLRINVGLLDRLMTLAGELVLVRNQALLGIDTGEPGTRRIVQRLNAVTSELQDTVMRTRMQPVGNLFNKFPRIVRDLARGLGKRTDLAVEGHEVELDKSILEMLSDPLTHLIRNSCDHGIETPAERRLAGKAETGAIELRASHEGSQIHITIRDDGRGIDTEKVKRKALQQGLKSAEELAAMGPREILSLILLPGFTTAERITDVSGRGVGMDVVQTNVDKLGGTLEIESVPGAGSTFSLRLPLTVAIIPCLLVAVGEDRFAIPQKDLEELVCLFPDQAGNQIEYAFDQEVYRLRQRLLPLVRLSEVLARRQPFTAEDRAAIVEKHRPKERGKGSGKSPLFFAVVRAGRHRYGLIVDRILNTEEIVVKPMQSTMKALRCYSGATIMGDGRVALILDLEGVARHAAVSFDLPLTPVAVEEAGERDAQSVLLFQYGEREQFAMALPMIRRVVLLPASRLERIGDREFVTIDGVSTRVLRLDQFLHVSPAPEMSQMYLLLPRNVRRPVGLLMTRILDTATLSTQLDTETCQEDGVLGSTHVNGRLTLVLDIFRLADRVEGGAVARPAPGKKRRVLLVEDTQFFRLLVKGYLEGQGYEVATAVNGAKGLEVLEQEKFDLIVSDIEMPEMDGWNFARAVRQRPQLRNVPLLALSTLSSPADQARALECGFSSYEVKLDRDRFLGAVRRLLP